MKNKVTRMVMCLFLVLGLIITPIRSVEAQVQKITIDEDEYNLWVEDIPSFTSEWNALFAKLNNIKDTSAYALSLFDDASSTELLLAGLEKAGVTADLDNVYGMDVMLYKLEEDQEYYPVDGSINTTIICPVPDLWLEQAEYVQLYQLNSSGKAVKHSFSLVSVDGVACMKFTIKATGVYGFVLQDKKADATVDQEKPTKAPTPTQKPTQVPTQKPTKAPTVVTPTKAPLVTIAPTKVPERAEAPWDDKTQTSVNSSTQAARPLDETPETGDEITMETWLLAAGLSGTAIISIFLYLKKH